MSSSQAQSESKDFKADTHTNHEEADEEPDEWDQRITKTGCSEENLKLTDCYWEKKDWRACKDEMKEFQDCWKRHGNVQRTDQNNSQ